MAYVNYYIREGFTVEQLQEKMKELQETVRELRVIWRELQQKALFVNSGVDTFSNAERFAYAMLKDIRHKFEETPEEDIVDTGYDFAEMNKDG